MLKLLIATGNQGKVKEIAEFLKDLPVQIYSLKDFPETFEPEETGVTFAENAELKARSYALQTEIWALADDSGLEVEALDNAPGVYSARYGGKELSDQARIEKLLAEIGDSENRRARFVCAMTIADEKGEIKFTTEGVCEGQIALNAKGSGGFGYDPVFIPENYSETFGELPNETKQQISHRKRAIDKIIGQIRLFYADRT